MPSFRFSQVNVFSQDPLGGNPLAVVHAAEGLSRQEADPLVRKLVDKFKDNQKGVPIGKPFNEVYDVESVQPKTEWQQIYEEVCIEVEEELNLNL